MFSYLPCNKNEEATKAVGDISTTMLFGVGFNNGVNYDPFNPLDKHDENKDRKAANRIAGLVTKVRNEAMFRPW